MRRKGNRHQPGSAHGPRGSQGPLNIPCGHPHRWFRFGTFSDERAQAPWHNRPFLLGLLIQPDRFGRWLLG